MHSRRRRHGRVSRLLPLVIPYHARHVVEYVSGASGDRVPFEC